MIIRPLFPISLSGGVCLAGLVFSVPVLAQPYYSYAPPMPYYAVPYSSPYTNPYWNNPPYWRGYGPPSPPNGEFMNSGYPPPPPPGWGSPNPYTGGYGAGPWSRPPQWDSSATYEGPGPSNGPMPPFGYGPSYYSSSPPQGFSPARPHSFNSCH